ncbi:MAG TPA: aldo/keto reductase [Panacibacter sp.]|nr:aldo/keto reductase [Panacibacter sp.]
MNHQIQPIVTLNNGMQMPLLGLGVYDMHAAEAETAIVKALETGYRLIDTATAYNNETEVGNAIRASAIPRSEIFVTTKVANPSQGYDLTLKAFDESFKKLNIEYIDLYLVHWPIKGKRKDTWRALEQLYLDKKVRAIGVANYLIPFLEELKDYASVVPVVNQVEFTAYLFLKDLMEYCNKQDIQLQAYSPIVRGRKNTDPKLVALAEKYHKTPVQMLLRWIIEHGVSAIPKSSNPKRIEENFNIFDFEISTEDMVKMDHFNENLRIVEDPMAML